MIYDQEVIRITLYVTGMYLGIQVKVPKDASILIAMKIVTADSANVSPRTFKLTLDRRGFFSSITVEQENGSAVSRQGHTRLRADGFYSFKHQARAEQPLLVWQYYLSDRNDIPKSGQDGGPPNCALQRSEPPRRPGRHCSAGLRYFHRTDRSSVD